MSEEKKPKKKSSALPKEHKKPWQENLATMAEIKAFVTDTTDEIESRKRLLAIGDDSDG